MSHTEPTDTKPRRRLPGLSSCARYDESRTHTVRQVPISSRMQCPVCQRRAHGVVSPGCIICDGIGMIYLGDPALTIYHPKTVAEAVTLTLEEAGAMQISGDRPDPEAVAAVRKAMLRLRGAGVLDAETTTLTRAMAYRAEEVDPADWVYTMVEPGRAAGPFRISRETGRALVAAVGAV